MERGEDRKNLFRQRTKKYASEIIRFYCELPKNRMECQVLVVHASRYSHPARMSRSGSTVISSDSLYLSRPG
jgi:hypothetical protein